MKKDVIKKVPLDVMQYAHELKEWIKENQDTYFEKYKAYHWRDLEYFYQVNNSDRAVTRRELVMPEEHLLIDRDVDGVHMYVICRIYGKIDGKARCKHIYPVIAISELENWRNGYFLLPNF